MATKTIRVPSAETAAKTVEVIRRVLGDGGSTAVTPYTSGSRQLWFVPDSQADDGASVSRWNYTGKLYTTPNGATPISTTAIKARNTYEARNTSVVRGGFTVTPGSSTCGVIIGIEPARPQVPYLVTGKQVIASVTYYLFAHPNDPKLKE